MPPVPPASPSLDRARKIVAKGLCELKRDVEVWPFGKDGNVLCFTTDEREQLKIVRDRVSSYLRLVNHKRPLCIAVLGPPGSGKSTGVGAICEELGAPLKWDELNLTQFESPGDLARAVAASVERITSDGSSVPFILFDEFDTAMNGAPLGWLSWFLAPMQDGKFMADGKPVKAAKAVYVFAGGTAATVEEFGARNRDAFRLAKGPDFVSRLHSYIEVRGPNDSEGLVIRRSAALRFALGKVAERTGKKFKLDGPVVDRLVSAGRYRHGQRSVEAVITMMAERTAPSVNLGRDALPDDFLLDMQVDRGPLDPQTIGGLVGLSGGGFPKGKKRDDRDDIWEKLAQSVWRLGATVAYDQEAEQTRVAVPVATG